MIIVQHRRNSIEELGSTDRTWGVEVDLRNHGGDILVTHDPFDANAVRLDEWLDQYSHRFLIANVKEEGLEPRLLRLLEDRGISDYFVLDESFPYILKYAQIGFSRFAVRVSELESEETALRLADSLRLRQRHVDWIWLDTFSGRPTPLEVVRALRQAGFRLCLVSPELHHVADVDSWEHRIKEFQNDLFEMGNEGVGPDMVCTKRPDLWAEFTK